MCRLRLTLRYDGVARMSLPYERVGFDGFCMVKVQNRPNLQQRFDSLFASKTLDNLLVMVCR